MTKKPGRKRPLSVVGWRARVDLPELGIRGVQAKVDTGARTSSLHATHVAHFERDGERWVRFRVHWGTRGAREQRMVEAPLSDVRTVRSSNGTAEERCVIRTKIKVQDRIWRTEITLAKRGTMAFPMLLGRACLKDRFLVDTGHSFIPGPTRVEEHLAERDASRRAGESSGNDG